MKLFTLRPSGSEFERQVLPHLDGAYRLALWLVRDAATAEDVVQDAVLKAHAAWGRYTAGNTRAWLFTIVRRQAYDWLRQARHATVDVDDEAAWTTEDAVHLRHEDTPETSLVAAEMVERLREALLGLPAVFREVIMLKDIEDMPYKTIAEVLNVPVGTVMSRLARGRDMLRVRLTEAEA
ncbi:sigma-70 family RNA polymerase sigma factor [Asticcacaulis solisilvae]|uniref:sigma-70 family RNA polymerase sigma factor n=1 Tax=Asticcacaulis solisilvae TaxID=1217274 RepID=UPI003FD6FEE0